MALMPNRTKYAKQMKGRLRGKATRGNKITYGQFGMQALEAGFITGNQIEAARIAMNNYMKRGGKVWIKIFPDKPMTKKPAETRMGKGKGAVEYWVARVKPGKVMFEIAGVSKETAEGALRRAAYKLPIKVKFLERKLTKKELEELEEEVEKERIRLEAEAKAAAEAAEAAAEVAVEDGEHAEHTEHKSEEKDGEGHEN